MPTQPLIEVTTTLSETAEIDLSYDSRLGYFEVTCHAVDSSGDYIAADTGTGPLEVISLSGTQWEAVYEQDGTTPEQFDFTGDSRTVVVDRSPADKIRVVPDSLTGASVAGIRLAVYELE